MPCNIKSATNPACLVTLNLLIDFIFPTWPAWQLPGLFDDL